MKTTLLSLLFLLCFWAHTATAQTPQSIAYQAIARNSAGNAIISAPVGIRASILTGSATGTAVYVETHTPTTNSAGLFVLSLGLGTATTGTFATIDWATGTKFLKIDMDVAGGTNYVTVGTTQLLSVPYALYADKVNPANLPTDKDQQNLSIAGNSLSISGGNSINLPAQTLSIVGDSLALSGGNKVKMPVVPATLPASFNYKLRLEIYQNGKYGDTLRLL